MSLKLPPVPERIKQLTPYKPGKPIEELERELGISGAIKMASNENPLGPSPLAQEAIAGCLGNLHRYPDGAAFELRQALSKRLGLSMEQVAVTNGSNEMIELLCRAFVRPGDRVVTAQYPFSMYAKLVQVAGGELKEVPLKEFCIDLDGILGAMDESTRLVFINSPHNPAGTALSRGEFSDFLSRVPPGVITVADEAYIDFADDPDTARGAEFVSDERPLVVMRTFSKSYGLAGLRLGMGLGPVAVMDILNRVRQPFNTSIPAQVAALAALGDEEFLRRSLDLVIRGRGEFYRVFDELGLAYVPSQTNFVLVKVGPRALDIQQALLRLGVIVRPMDSYALPEYLRISVGTDAENQRFLEGFRSLVKGC